MKTIIRSTYVNFRNETNVFVENIVRAAEQCIASAGIEKDQIDMLIDISIYRKENIIEPAIAHFVQKELGINPTYQKGKKTFSFDLMNGANGFLSAVLMIDSFFKNNTLQRALVVSGDLHPSGKKTDDFPFTHVGAAALLENSEEKEGGFERIKLYTSNDSRPGLSSFVDLAACGNKGRETVAIQIDSDYYDRLEEFTVSSLASYVIESAEIPGIDLSNLTLIISQPTRDFGKNVARRLGLRGASVVDTFERYGDTHTSALTVGYYEAVQNGRIHKGDTVLFAGAGSGLTVSAGLYRV